MPPFTGRGGRPASTAAHGWLEPVRGVVQNPKTPRTSFQPVRGVSQNPKTPKGGFRKPVRGVVQNSKTPKGGFRKPQTPPIHFSDFPWRDFRNCEYSSVAVKATRTSTASATRSTPPTCRGR